MNGRTNPNNRKVQVQFEPNATRDQVVAVVEHIIRSTGCMTSGIRGVDINLMGGDPDALTQQLRGQSGVVGVIDS
jgi:hypothetical protein